MNDIDIKILDLLRINGRMTVPQLLDAIYPNAPDYKKSTLRSKLYTKCKNLMLYHYIDRVEDGKQVLWEVRQ